MIGQSSARQEKVCVQVIRQLRVRVQLSHVPFLKCGQLRLGHDVVRFS